MDAFALKGEQFWQSQEPYAFGRPVAEDLRHELMGHVLFQTSGTCGQPKEVAISRAALEHSARAVNAHLEVVSGDVWGLALPWHHVGGFGVIARARVANCGLSHFGERWQPEAFCQWLKRERVSLVSVVPTQVHDLVRAGLQAPLCVRVMVVGGGALAGEAAARARELGWPLRESYGMTETASQVATQGADGSSAELEVLPIWQVRVAADGCLEVAGQALFSGYVVGQGSAVRYEPRQGEWFHTADIVALNERTVCPLGRADRRVKILGELVDLAAIEARLAALGGEPWWGGFALVAMPDARAGMRLVLVVEEDVPNPEVVLEAYHAECAGYERIAEWRSVPQLERTELGKIKTRAAR